jgi:Domain of unknown function (DUF222)
MDSNWCSPDPTAGPPDDLAALAAAVDGLAARPPPAPGRGSGRAGADPAAAGRPPRRPLAGRAGGRGRLRGGRGRPGHPGPSTASWLRDRLHLGAGAASNSVRTARALFRGPLSATAEALCDGEVSAAHASVLAHGLADHVATEAEPVPLAAARRMDPPRLRRVLGHLRQVADPDGADEQAERRHGRPGLWLARPGRAWSPCRGCWRPRPARSCWRPWSPGPPPQRSGFPQRRPAAR